MSGIQDKVIAITGAGGGTGAAAARVLAGRGARLMLGARDIGRLYALAHEIVEAGGSAHYQVLDVTRRASMQCFIDEARRVFGRVDAVVHSVGVMALSTLEALGPGVAVIALDAIGCEGGTAPDAMARAIAQAIGQPAEVDAGRIVVRSTLCRSGSGTQAMRRLQARCGQGLRLV